MWQTDFRDLVADAANGSGASAVAWATIPQGQPTPFVGLTLVTEDWGHTYQGSDGSSTSRVQIDAWAPSLLPALAITNAIGSALDCYRGVKGGTRFTAAFVVDAGTGYEEIPTGVIHRSRIDVVVHHTAED